MFSPHALRIELHRAGTVIALDVQDERALIGSGSHCDVRLAPDEAAVEQLLVEVVGDDVYVRTRSLQPTCLLNGAPFLEGRVAPSAMIEFGGVGICVAMVARQDGDARARRGRRASTSPGIQALGLAAVALGLYAAANPPARAGKLALAPLSPPPPGALAQEPCPQREPRAALVQAEQLGAEADTKRERAPFHPGDALAGAALFARAASCFETAGLADAAREERAKAIGLQQRASDQLHLAHIRIERGLAEHDYEETRRDAELALSLMPQPKHPYAHWLLTVKRECLLRTQSGAHR